MTLGYSLKDLKRKIIDFQPDLVGISMMTILYEKTYGIIREIKEVGTKFKVVVGGPHVSSLREKVLEECPQIDFGAVLEGEETIIELCEGKDIPEIKGLIYRDGDNVVFNGERRFIEDLDSVPFPTYEKFELEKYIQKRIPMTTSRGCPYSCTFCTIAKASGRMYRARSAGNIVDEIEYWAKRGYKQFSIDDDNFTLLKDRVYEICDELEKRMLNNLEFHLGNSIRADKVDRKLLRRMKEVGFRYIGIAVEGNDKVLKNIRKGEDLETIKRAIKNACDVGMDVTLTFLINVPGQTWADLEESFEIARKYPVRKADFFVLLPYPGSELFDWVQEKNYFIRPPHDYLNEPLTYRSVVFKTPDLSIEQIKKAVERAKHINQQLLRNRLLKMLKKYGFLGQMGAYLLATEFIQTNLRRKRRFRRIMDEIRLWVESK